MHVLQSPLLPLGAPSPTLTNPDMILPQSSPSTIRKPQRLPSPEPSDSGQNTFDSSNDDEHGIKGATYSPFRNGLPRRHDGPARIQSSFERGERIDQFQQSGSSREAGGEVPFASSPTIRDEYSLEEPKSYSEHASQDDGLADTSDSVYKTASVLDEDEDDPYSHAAMTRRAEEILANAKKRLTVSICFNGQ